jgi:arginyl-tRNA synthetase
LKTLIEELLTQALAALPESAVPAEARSVGIEVENTRDAQHGDFASNLAMRLAKATRQNPRKLAEALVRALPPSTAVAKVEIAGAGFINFFLSRDAYHAEIGTVLRDGRQYGRSLIGAGKSMQVEFVSANPTGPLHVAHGRHAAFGASLANLLEAVGYRVEREYYINDAGRQMDILAVSSWLRYLEHCGERFTFPANGYVGEYIAPIAAQLFAAEGTALKASAAEVFDNLPPDEPQGGDKDIYIDAVIGRARTLIGNAAFERVLRLSLDGILADIREDLAEFRVTFDCWFSERSLGDIEAGGACLSQGWGPMVQEHGLR